MSPKKAGQESVESTTTGFTDDERAAMKERAAGLKAEARRGARGQKAEADAEIAVLAAIAAMPEPDRAIGERLHAIIRASAPALAP